MYSVVRRKKMYTSYVFINARSGEEGNLVKELSKMSGVTRVNTLMGKYDAVAILEKETLDELFGIVLRNIRSLPSVAKTETLMAASEKMLGLLGGVQPSKPKGK
jgi:DNA-binding Lrp family transcriptional regulator